MSTNQQTVCCVCKSKPQFPLILSCKHQICYQCAEQIKTTEVLSQNDILYLIECQNCQQITQANFLDELINKQHSENLQCGKNKRLNDLSNIELNNNNYQNLTTRCKLSPSLINQFTPRQESLQINSATTRETIQQKKKKLLQSKSSINLNANDQKFNKKSSPKPSTHQSPLNNKFSQIVDKNQLEILHKILNYQQTDDDRDESWIKAQSKTDSSIQRFKQYEQICPTNYCKIHNQEFSLFCVYEKKLCCVDCIYKDSIHKGHNIIMLKQAINILREESIQCKNEFREKHILIDESIKNCQQNKSQLESNYFEVNEYITKEFQKIISEVQQRLNLLKDMVKSTFQTKMGEINTKINDLNFIKKQITDYQSTGKNFFNNNSDNCVQMFQLSRKIKKMIKQNSIYIQQNDKNEMDIFDFSNKHIILLEISNLGKLKGKSSSHASCDKRNLMKMNTLQGQNQSKVNNQGNSSKSPKNSLKPLIESNINNTDYIYRRSQSPDNCNNNTGNVLERQLIMQRKKKIYQKKNNTNNITFQNLSNQYQDKENNYEQYLNLPTPIISVDEQNENQLKTLFADSTIFTPQLRTSANFSVLPQSIRSTQQLFKLSKHGASSNIFHQQCDNKNPYIVFIEANNYIFGYYLPIPFQKSEKYFSCDNCWIFSLKNVYEQGPLKFEIKQDKKFIALYQSLTNPCLGSTFQNNQDLWIDFDNPNQSCSKVGYAYEIDQKYNGSIVLAGSYTNWNIRDIEIYTFSS